MNELRLATRRSALALAQAGIVADALAGIGVPTSVVPIVTSGDRDRSSPVAALTEVGAFVRGVQEAVLAGRADVAVHSCKDLPVNGPAALTTFYPDRAAPGDVMCGLSPETVTSARVGTGSPRRAAQLRLVCPDAELVEVRGNVPTRLRRITAGEVAAVVLAEAGLIRLGLHGEITYRFALTEMVPAPAQGAIAVEALRSSVGTLEALRAIDQPSTRRAVEAERALLSRTGAGCRSALGAYATGEDKITMWGFVEDDRGPRRGRAEAESPEEAAAAMQKELGL